MDFESKWECEYSIDTDQDALKALVDEYNAKNSTSFALMSPEAYSISSPEGKISIGDKSVSLDIELDPSAGHSGRYIIPVALKSVDSPLKVSEQAKVCYVVVNCLGQYVDKSDWTLEVSSANPNCSKPTGLNRMYPNVVTYEAVRGAECSKWDLTANPEHHLTIPFVRMLCGSLDYTPGSMRNKSISFFKPVDPGMPSTQGTRCHELAMFVVLDQYLASLCDSPAEYLKYPDIMRFLSSVPVSFDETVVLDAVVGDKIVTAKRKGDVWYVGGMTDWTARSEDVDFSFLDKGRKYNSFWLVDDESSNLYADRYKCVTGTVSNGDRQQVRMASGGGFVLVLTPAD